MSHSARGGPRCGFSSKTISQPTLKSGPTHHRTNQNGGLVAAHTLMTNKKYDNISIHLLLKYYIIYIIVTCARHFNVIVWGENYWVVLSSDFIDKKLIFFSIDNIKLHCFFNLNLEKKKNFFFSGRRFVAQVW